MDNDREVNRTVKLIAKLFVDKASEVFAKFIKAKSSIELEKAYMADISTISVHIGEIDKEVIGSIIELEGEAPFRFLYYVGLEEAFILTDLILRRPTGTTKEYGPYVQSAVQEIGNVLSSAITNVMATDFQVEMQPSPPMMVHDFVGTVFETYAMDIAAERNDLIIIESKFRVVEQDICSNMYIMPKESSEKILSYLINCD